MAPFINIAAYKFTPLSDLKPLRERLTAQCKEWGLKGTILLSTEGINLFMAGKQAEIDQLLSTLRAIPGLEDLQPKISESEEQPFRRMLVRIKKEIIAFGVPGVEPGKRTSPKLSAQTLKEWLDEGRKITLLDTRNDYEVKLGTFKNALPIGINHFRDFPAAVRELPEEMKEQPIVMFCTGGIRCEKAGPFMEMEGFQKIFQLDGGILKYFEECGSEHYQGECFVFDQRVGVDPSLHETGSGQCYACQIPLSEEDQNDPRYVEGKSCPYCFKSDEDRMQEIVSKRQEAFRAATTPLPGGQPYDNYRPLNISAAYDGQTLLDCLCGILPHVPREEWQSRCEQQRLMDEDHQPAATDRIVRAGERYLHLKPATIEPEVNADLQLLYEDEAILVLHKPAPLPMHPGGRFNRNTVQYILDCVYSPQKPRPAHRLDANTTGLVVCSRTRRFAASLQPQFARGEVEKVYLVRVQGHPVEERFTCDTPISAVPGAMGSREVDEEAGQPSRTEFRVLNRDDDGTALLEARPITGRTNQIRVHLWQLGWPVVGDQAYRPEQQLGDTQTLSPNDPPLCLHAWRISFTHPLSGKRVSFEAEPPQWAERSVELVK
ncbi:sulfurtransferase [Verrucomicrobiota bacterium sgz303538]